jgi:hypothetical protein
MIPRQFRNQCGVDFIGNLVECKGGRGQGQGGGKGYRHGAGEGGGGRGGGNKPMSGPGGNCVCPKCGHKEPHQAGKRCIDQTCPECGAKMMRE